MSISTAFPPGKVPPGPSRFRVRVVRVASGARPYGWELYDEETAEVIRRSALRFRAPAEAWTAGLAGIEHSPLLSSKITERVKK
jgi:hypothetical protein